MRESPSILVKNEQAHPKEPQHTNIKPETDTAGIGNVLTIYIRTCTTKGTALEALTENTAGHKTVTVSSELGQQDLICCRSSGNSGLEASKNQCPVKQYFKLILWKV